PVRPITVLDDQRNGTAQRGSEPDTRQKLDFVRFDLHPTAPAISAHAALQFTIDELGPQPQASRHPVQDRHQRRTVRLPCGQESEHGLTPCTSRKAGHYVPPPFPLSKLGHPLRGLSYSV